MNSHVPSAVASQMNYVGRRILVTGAGGFIGAALVNKLARMGATVTAASRTAGRLDPQSTQYRFISCDLRSLEQTKATVSEALPTLVFHLAGQPDGKEEPSRTHIVVEHNIVAAGNLLHALTELPAVSVVYGDSAKVFGNGPVPYRSDQRTEPCSSYAVSKQACWGLIDVYRRVHGMQVIGLRPTLVYGPGQSFNVFSFLIQAVMEGRTEVALDGGSQTRDPLYIDDAVDAFIAAAANCRTLNGENLPIGGGREMSVEALAKLTVRTLGGHQRVRTRPVCVRPTETQRSWCDNAEALHLLHWQPKVSFEDGILLTSRSMGLLPLAPQSTSNSKPLIEQT